MIVNYSTVIKGYLIFFIFVIASYLISDEKLSWNVNQQNIK